MTCQTLLTAAAVVLSVAHFIRGFRRDLQAVTRGACGACASGGCPAARKG